MTACYSKHPLTRSRRVASIGITNGSVWQVWFRGERGREWGGMKGQKERGGKRKKNGFPTHIYTHTHTPCSIKSFAITQLCWPPKETSALVTPLSGPEDPEAAVHPNPLASWPKILKCTHFHVWRNLRWETDPKHIDSSGPSPSESAWPWSRIHLSVQALACIKAQVQLFPRILCRLEAFQATE